VPARAREAENPNMEKEGQGAGVNSVERRVKRSCEANR
jgi:hypothetical protein